MFICMTFSCGKVENDYLLYSVCEIENVDVSKLGSCDAISDSTITLTVDDFNYTYVKGRKTASFYYYFRVDKACPRFDSYGEIEVKTIDLDGVNGEFNNKSRMMYDDPKYNHGGSGPVGLNYFEKFSQVISTDSSSYLIGYKGRIPCKEKAVAFEYGDSQFITEVILVSFEINTVEGEKASDTKYLKRYIDKVKLNMHYAKAEGY